MLFLSAPSKGRALNWGPTNRNDFINGVFVAVFVVFWLFITLLSIRKLAQTLQTPMLLSNEIIRIDLQRNTP